MAVKTTTEQLEEVQGAITALMTGSQSYTIDGRTVTRADLKALNTREETLLYRYNIETNPTTAPKVSSASMGAF